MGGRGIYYGDSEWFRNNNFSWFPDARFRTRNWQFPKPNDRQCVKLTSKISERVSIKPSRYAPVGLATAVYNAQIVNGNHGGNQVVVKIFLRIPKISLGSREYVDKADLMARHLPIIEDLSETLNNCIQYTREHETLAHLTKSSCSSTPRYIANFEQNEANPWVRGGFLCFVVMSKIPGISVAEIWKERNPTEHQLRDRRQIQHAFKKALIEVSHLGVTQIDPAIRNIMYDRINSKCYLIDFEMSHFDEKYKPARWEDLASPGFHPDVTLLDWGLETPEVRDCLENSRSRSQTPSAS